MKVPGTFTGSVVSSAEMNGLGHVVTSSTRPTGAETYEGRRIYETDTSFWQSYDGAAWSPVGPVDGALTSWTLQIDQGASSDIGKSSTVATYSRVGRQITGMFRAVFNASGTAGSAVLATLPVAASATSNTTVIGSGMFKPSGGQFRSFVVVIGVTANRMQFAGDVGLGGNYLGVVGVTIASGDKLTCTFQYEAAS